MKNGKIQIILLVLLLVTPIIPTNASAEKWTKYDDFNKSNQIDTDKWEIQDDNGTIEIENGRVKFVRIAGDPGGRHRLVFNECRESIIGIKATLEVAANCKSTDNVIAMLTHIGTFGGHYSAAQAAIEPNLNRIAGSMPVLDQNDNYDYLYSSFWSNLTSGVDVVQDGPFTVSIVFNSKKIIFEVEGHGKVVYDIPESLKYKLEHWARIGAWTRNGQGPCTFYVDNVYVMRKGGCDKRAPKIKKTIPKRNKKKVSRNTDWLEVIFSETMQANHSVSTVGPWPVSGGTSTEWVNGNTFRIWRDNAGSPLPPNSKIEVVLNPGGSGFQDLKGLSLKEYTI